MTLPRSFRYWSDKAEAEGKPRVAKMFRAVAAAEKVHAANHWMVLGQVKDTAANLQRAIEGEDHEIDEMYPAFKAVAEHQAEKGATRTMHWALETEKVHSKMYKEALETVDKGSDIELGDVHVCPVCGFTMEGTVPDYCPFCNANKDKFVEF